MLMKAKADNGILSAMEQHWQSNINAEKVNKGK